MVTSGLYKYTKNQVYVGYILIIIGITLVTGALIILLYTILAIIFIYSYVVYYKKPCLDENLKRPTGITKKESVDGYEKLKQKKFLLLLRCITKE
ncbi:MAG: methyltransferase [Candidatus Nanoarchaeia archaeon]